LFGGGSIQLLRVFGIRIGVDASWFLFLFLIIWSLSGYYGDLFPGEDTKSFLLAVVSALLFVTSIALHELGHALQARRDGIGITGINLWLFGGVALLDKDADSPGAAFRVSVAGPLVTLAITAACFAGGAAIGGVDEVWESMRFGTGDAGEAVAVLGYLAFINAALLVFNLIPGYPLDGGQMLRAYFWWRTGDRTRATRTAARTGRGVSFLMVALGVLALLQGLFVAGIWLVFIGVFLGSAARQTEWQTRITARLEGMRVADVMDAEPVAVPEDLPLDRAEEEYFLRYRWPWFPVVDAGGRLTGLVAHEAVEGVPEAARPGRTVASVMASDADSAFRVGVDEPLESLLGREALQRLGAVMAVDGDGRLRGIVTADVVRRALRGPATAPA
jgi:Zn-dependent protease/CBS domain-containing protein